MKFEEIFDHTYRAPNREPKLGHCWMVVCILMLLFIGFNRFWHFIYIRLGAMICGSFQLTRLPAASTFWRYVDSLGINQANSFLKVMSILRERVWQQWHLKYQKIHAGIDTTAETIYSNQQECSTLVSFQFSFPSIFHHTTFLSDFIMEIVFPLLHWTSTN